MSLLYGTDKRILDNSYDISYDDYGSIGVDLNRFPWLGHYREVNGSNVTDAHFRRYLTESDHYSERDAVMFDLYKKGILKVREVYSYGPTGGEEDFDEETTIYRYSLSAKSLGAKEQVKKLVLSAVKKDQPYGKQSLEQASADIKRYLQSYEVDGADEVIDGVTADLEAGARDRIDPKIQKAELDDAVQSAADTDVSREKAEQNADRLMTGLRGAIYAHRNHSAFYAIFHPINYYREAQSIANAKQALVNLGASAEKVDEFERNVIAEDHALRDEKNAERAAELRENIATTLEQMGPEAEEAPVDTSHIADVPEDDDLEDDLAFYDGLETATSLSDEKAKDEKTSEPVISNPETSMNKDEALCFQK